MMDAIAEMRQCKGPCGEVKALDCFKNTRSDVCLSCKDIYDKEYQKQYRLENKEIAKELGKIYRKNNKEKLKLSKQAYAKKHTEEISLYQKQYRLENKDRLKKLNTIWRDKNKKELKEKKRIYDKNYRQNNKEKIQTYIKIYNKNQRNNNNFFKLRHSISTSILRALKENGGTKNNFSCLKFLQFTIRELEQHIESLFEPWMNWNNWRKYDAKAWDDNDRSTWVWNLDHIIPQSLLLYTSMEDDNFKKCWSLANLRPYSAKLNLLEGNRRSFKDILSVAM